jgi:hypothetical protein
VGRIGWDLVLCQGSFGLGHCNFVGDGREQERDCIVVVVVRDCIVVVELIGSCCIEELARCSFVDELEQRLLDELDHFCHFLGMMDRSNVRHMNRHRIGLSCHMDLLFLGLAIDIVIEELVEWVVVVREEQLANDLRWLGI